MAGPMPKAPPVTWVEAVAGVRGLLPFTLPPPRKPPDPSPPPTVGEEGTTPVPHPPGGAGGDDDDDDPDPHSTDGEGKEDAEAACDESSQGTNETDDITLADDETEVSEITDCKINQLSEEDMADGDFKCCFGCQDVCCPCCTETQVEIDWNDWDDLLKEHVTQNPVWCFLSGWRTTFGPLGMLADQSIIQAIVDTGASMTISPYRTEFVEYTPQTGKVLKGIGKGLPIAGVGIIHWKLEVGTKVIDLKLRALHVPEGATRLLCPQQLKQEHKPKVKLATIEDDCVRLEFAEGVVECHYNDANLPVVTVCTPAEADNGLKALNACVTQEANQNLTVAQKELLKWHCKLGHMDFKRVQKLLNTGAMGDNPKIKAAAKLDLNKFPLMCGSCAYGKAKRKASRPKRARTTNEEKVLSKDVLIPGQKVSMDHFICSTQGRLFNSRGRESEDRRFKGGVIFVDHGSGHVYIEPVVNFTAGEAIRAKHEFEREMASMGVTVINYHTDNGVFTASAFQDELAKMEQGLSLQLEWSGSTPPECCG